MDKRAYYGLSQTDKYLAACGAPVSYLQEDFKGKTFKFSDIAYRVGQKTIAIQSKKQDLIFEFLMDNPGSFGSPTTICVSSFPTDENSYYFAVHLSRILKEKIPTSKTKWFDLGYLDYNYMKEGEIPELVVIQGLYPNSDFSRIEKARDLLIRYGPTTKILITATDNILEYINTKIFHKVDVVFKVSELIERSIK